MKINSANSTNFQAITYRPGCQKYVAEYLTSRDKGVLRRAERAMSRCRKWDLEITSKGLRIASKKTADAILVEESRLCNVPHDRNLSMKAIYDGHSETCETGQYCKFDIKLPSYEAAMAQYARYSTMPLVEKAIDLVEKFEKQDVIFTYNKHLVRKIWDILFN